MIDAVEGKKTGGGAPQRRDSILELQKLMDASVLVKCQGGREIKGTLRGFDDLVNLVLDDSEEFIRGTCGGSPNSSAKQIHRIFGSPRRRCFRSAFDVISRS